jgi:uncharacterized membrane protein YhiD involved in acid resistance
MSTALEIAAAATLPILCIVEVLRRIAEALENSDDELDTEGEEDRG